MWYFYTREFYSATKKNEILSFADEWTEMKNLILNDVNQVQKAKATYFLSHVEYRPNINTAIFEKQVTLRGGHIQDRKG
jgi:hypothetical protein